MMTTEQLKTDKALIDEIDWSMTPEKAIEMYLEWGTGWVRGHDFVSSHGQESIYFVIYDWEEPQATLIRRTVDGADEIAKVPVPAQLFKQAADDDGYSPGVGVHPLNLPLKEWVCDEIGGPPLNFSS